jgi:hypothetical protein
VLGVFGFLVYVSGITYALGLTEQYSAGLENVI